MAFDESGPSKIRKCVIQICKRSYKLLVEKTLIFRRKLLFFDPNILRLLPNWKHNIMRWLHRGKTRQIERITVIAMFRRWSNISFSFRGKQSLCVKLCIASFLLANSVPVWTMECQCGSARGFMTSLPADLEMRWRVIPTVILTRHW